MPYARALELLADEIPYLLQALSPSTRSLFVGDANELLHLVQHGDPNKRDAYAASLLKDGKKLFNSIPDTSTLDIYGRPIKDCDSPENDGVFKSSVLCYLLSYCVRASQDSVVPLFLELEQSPQRNGYVWHFTRAVAGSACDIIGRGDLTSLEFWQDPKYAYQCAIADVSGSLFSQILNGEIDKALDNLAKVKKHQSMSDSPEQSAHAVVVAANVEVKAPRVLGTSINNASAPSGPSQSGINH